MKKIIFLGGMVIIGALVVLNATNTSEVINQITATTTVEVLPEWAEDEDAVEAAQAVIRRKELEVELSNLEAGFASTTAQYNAAKAVYLSEKERIEKELGTYWTVKANLKNEIRKTFADDPITAVAVAGGESQYNPMAYNPEWHYDRLGNKICQGSFGLMQIACVHYQEDPKKLFDVEFNLAMAKKIYQTSGWKPWGAYTDGGYKKYLTMI